MKRKKPKEVILETIKCDRNKEDFTVSQIDLSKIEFKELDLSGLDFSQSNLRKSKFNKCNLTNVSFRGANLTSAKFYNCTFKDANLEFVDCDNAKFVDCDIKNGNFKNSSAKNIIWKKIKAENVLLEGSALNNAVINDCTCERIQARGALFEDATFRNCVFLNSDFTAANFIGAYWQQNQFDNVTFVATQAREINLHKVNIVKSDFSLADFRTAYGMSKELRNKIIKCGGIVSPQYLRLVWNNIYGRSVIISLIGILIGTLIFLSAQKVNDFLWSVERVNKIVGKAIQEEKLVQAEKYIKKCFDKNKLKLSLIEKMQLEMLLGDVYRDSKRVSEAKKIYKEIIQRKEATIMQKIQSRLHIMDLSSYPNDKEEILAFCNAIKEDVNKVSDNYERGQILLRIAHTYDYIGNRAAAEQTYREIINISHTDWYGLEASESIAMLYREEGKWDKAMREYEKLIEILPEEDIERRENIKKSLQIVRSHSGKGE
ncbi:MAG: pentapeptide repeat-containing protein [Candidatus Omnitrophica bacterium]|nr:pentapeptide repeat-containing protein [Candidatus Omnitrophota bacterium]